VSADDLARFAAEVQTAAPTDLPALIGELARLQALALSRLTAPSVTAAPQETDKLLTMPEVAERLGITEHQAREMGRSRKLPTVHVGERHVRVSARALADWIAAHESSTLARRRIA
jgi:excisionase family DNA binding protein